MFCLCLSSRNVDKAPQLICTFLFFFRRRLIPPLPPKTVRASVLLGKKQIQSLGKKGLICPEKRQETDLWVTLVSSQQGGGSNRKPQHRPPPPWDDVTEHDCELAENRGNTSELCEKKPGWIQVLCRGIRCLVFHSDWWVETRLRHRQEPTLCLINLQTASYSCLLSWIKQNFTSLG